MAPRPPDELEPDPEAELDATQTALRAHPQRLGFLPTWWFWSDQSNWALVRAPAAVLVGVVTFVVAISGLSPVLAALVAIVLFCCAIGLIERYLRRTAEPA